MPNQQNQNQQNTQNQQNQKTQPEVRAGTYDNQQKKGASSPSNEDRDQDSRNSSDKWGSQNR